MFTVEKGCHFYLLSIQYLWKESGLCCLCLSFCSVGLHVAWVHEEEVWRRADKDIPGLSLSGALYLHQNIGKNTHPFILFIKQKEELQCICNSWIICDAVWMMESSFCFYINIQVNLYSGALFIQQSLNWNLYVSVFLLLGATAITTVTGWLPNIYIYHNMEAHI